MIYDTIFLQAGGSNLGNIILIPLMFLVIYLFMIRPQIRRQQLEKKFQASISRGAKVVTTSGIHGKVVELNDTDNTCVIETSAGKIKFERSAISMDLSKSILPKRRRKPNSSRDKDTARSSVFTELLFFYIFKKKKTIETEEIETGYGAGAEQ
ncbi:MAG: preprotein translocase subunit YajC [Flavobacteriaceae bacterium]|nr:preprotein translocase subunit YajC [Flavobacteriaceae bacterium]